MRFMVTGASGFVGSAVARLLLKNRYKLNLLVRENSTLPFESEVTADANVKIFRGDLSDTETLRRACEGCDGVFHVAAQYTYWSPNPYEMYRTNVDGTTNVLRAAIAAGVKRLVFTSTVGTFRRRRLGGLTTEKNTTPIWEHPSHYKRSKWMAEHAALDMNGSIEVVSVNPTAPFGEGDVRPTPTGRIVLQFLNNLFPGYVETGVNVCHVDDVAEGHLAAYFKGRPRERYLLGGENMSLKRIYQLLSEITGLKRYPLRVPWALAHLFALVDESVRGRLGHEPAVTRDALRVARAPLYVDCHKAVSELGYAPRSGKEALASSVAWFTNQRKARRVSNGSDYSLLFQK